MPWRQLSKSTNQSGERNERLPDLCFSICRLSEVVFILRVQPHAQSLFLFPIVFLVLMYHTFSHITFQQPHDLQIEHPFFLTHCYLNTSSDVTCVLGGGSFPVRTHSFSSRGVAAVRARRLFPSTISGVRGSVPILPLGRKLD